MLTWLAPRLYRFRWPVLAASLAGVVLAATFGAGVVDRLQPGGFQDPAAESSLASEALERDYPSGEANALLLVTAAGGDVDAPAAQRLGADLTRRLDAEPDVTVTGSYFATGAPALRSRDGGEALIVADVDGDQERLIERAEGLAAAYEREGEPATVQLGGPVALSRDVTERTESSLARAEAVAIPITLLLLVVAFGSVVAGALPLVVGGIAIVGVLLLLRGLAALTDVSVYALNITTVLGLGLAIDYSLFIVSRYREELRAGQDPRAALTATMATAGRTVLFSALTVIAALLALLVFPLYFLRSMGYAGISVVALAAVGALLVLPALLAVLGHRVDRLRLPWRRRRAAGQGNGSWHRLASGVMRRPVLVTVAVVAVLALAGSPALDLRFGGLDDRVLTGDTTSRQVGDVLREEFDGAGGELAVVAPSSGPPAAGRAAIDRYAASLSRLPGAARVDAFTGTYVDGRMVAPAAEPGRFAGERGTWLSVASTAGPDVAAGEDLVAAVRDLPAPFETQVTGPSAQFADTQAAIAERLPAAAAIVVAVTFVLLFLLTGGLLIPLKALVMNVLSLGAVYGVMVWVFQQGHLAGLLGFTATGTIDTSMPILLTCTAFGLSMDYEVFLLSRIKEEHDRTGDTTAAVATGLERSGWIVTAAAALLSVVFLSMATADVRLLKLFGVGAALAVVVDATLVRALLVPAVMRLAGTANWWAPRPLARLHRRLGLRETAAPPPHREPSGAGRL